MKSNQSKLTGIFGYPIGHTLSPAMHNAAFRQLNLNYVYVPFEVKPEELEKAIDSLRTLNISGVCWRPGAPEDRRSGDYYLVESFYY